MSDFVKEQIANSITIVLVVAMLLSSVTYCSVQSDWAGAEIAKACIDKGGLMQRGTCILR